MDVVSPLNIIVGEHHFIIHHQICPFTGQLLRFPGDLFPYQTLTQLRFLTTAHSTNQGGHLVSVDELEVIDTYSCTYSGPFRLPTSETMTSTSSALEIDNTLCSNQSK